MPRNDSTGWLRRAALAAPLLFSIVPFDVRAEDAAPTRSIEQVERELKLARDRERSLSAQAAAQVRAIEALRGKLAAAAAATQESEEQLSDAESRLAGLDAEQFAKAAELEHRRGELAALLAALTRLARNPPEALMLMPESPIDTVRTARLLADVVPPIEAQARQVAQDVEDLQILHDAAAAERATMAAATTRLAADREGLRALVAQRAEFYQQTAAAHAEAAEHVDALARQAADLRDLLRRLDENRAAARRPAAETPPDTVEARVSDALARQLRQLGEAHGQMAFPARGRVLLAYGQTGEGGQPQRGLTIETRPGAEIVAPFDGKIVFAGPFRGYGRILIIEHGEGYHTLLAGLGRIDVSVGQVVATGEPIATAGSPDTAGPSDISHPADIYSKGAAGPVLYVELRRHGQPINPLPWLATSNGKVSG
ncbi:MAG TPA: peptidoglycan DD-metalloendopeptidase family protein [Alphaproteobacteria bacterium]